MHPTAKAYPFLGLTSSGGQRSPNPVQLFNIFYLPFLPSGHLLLFFFPSFCPFSCSALAMKKYSFLPDLYNLWPITSALCILCSLSRSMSLCLLQYPSDLNWHITFCHTSCCLPIVNLSHSYLHPYDLIPHWARCTKPSDWSLVFIQYTLTVLSLVLAVVFFLKYMLLLEK